MYKFFEGRFFQLMLSQGPKMILVLCTLQTCCYVALRCFSVFMSIEGKVWLSSLPCSGMRRQSPNFQFPS